MTGSSPREQGYGTRNLIIPENYSSALDVRETEKAIKFIKDYFQDNLMKELNLSRISAPIVVTKKSGINDYLSGWEVPVGFDIVDMDNERGEIVQSLAKWKRKALKAYGFKVGEGLYTDMNAIRPNEVLDNLHSLYVDQWDWERIISAGERNLDLLKLMVEKIYTALKKTEKEICEKYPEIPGVFLPEKIHFIHSETLQERFPDLSPKQREDAICKEMGAVFVIGIGAELADGKPHDARATDYDDWSTETQNERKGLNGDILIWYPELNRAFELSSMGIRVDKDALLTQLKIKDEMHKKDWPYQKMLLNNELPLTIGGGIGQSRLCMLFLRKAHVGEVQASIWPKDMIQTCKDNNINLL